MKDKDDNGPEVVLTPGSKYRLKSLESRDSPLITHGEFIGYTAIANDEGICMKLDASHKDTAGRIRVIPVHMIICIDIIESAEKEKKAGSESGTMFG